jgi:hypothetical protein
LETGAWGAFSKTILFGRPTGAAIDPVYLQKDVKQTRPHAVKLRQRSLQGLNRVPEWVRRGLRQDPRIGRGLPRGPDVEKREQKEPESNPDQHRIRTIYRWPDGMARYYVANDVVYELDGTSAYYIEPDASGLCDGIVHRYGDGSVAYWISEGYLHCSGERPSLYFGVE